MTTGKTGISPTTAAYPPSNIYFPVGTNEFDYIYRKFDNMAQTVPTTAVGEELVYQPYSGKNHRLFGINDVSEKKAFAMLNEEDGSYVLYWSGFRSYTDPESGAEYVLAENESGVSAGNTNALRFLKNTVITESIPQADFVKCQDVELYEVIGEPPEELIAIRYGDSIWAIKFRKKEESL